MPATPFDYLAQPKETVTSCPCCESNPDQWRTLSTVDRYKLPVRFVYCERCAFVFANPRMTQAAYDRFYRRGHYRQLLQSHSGDDPAPATVWQSQLLHAGWIVREFGPRLQVALAGGGRLLDLGGGPGGVAAGIRQAIPCEATVVDPAAEEIAHARQQGLTAHVGTAESWQPDGQYDVVLLLQTIDHLLDPLATLQKCRAITRGLLLVDVVDFPYWWAANQQHGKGGCNALKVDHPSNFHADGLHALLARAGFAVAERKEVPSLQGHRRLWCFAAQPAPGAYTEARPGPAMANRLVKGCYQAHTWIGRYHAQPQ